MKTVIDLKKKKKKKSLETPRFNAREDNGLKISWGKIIFILNEMGGGMGGGVVGG